MHKINVAYNMTLKTDRKKDNSEKSHESSNALSDNVRDLLSKTESPLGSYKVSMLTHTYPHKPLMKIIVIICNQQADSPLYV